MNEPDLRVADTDRERAANALGEHFSAGRLDLEEYHERLDQVHRARTRADLEAPFRDLPSSQRTDERDRVPARPEERDVWLRAAAMASSLSLVLFLACGFAFNGWYWSWVFFMVPGALAGMSKTRSGE